MDRTEAPWARRPIANAAAIRSIQDTMRKDAGVDGDAQRIAQLVWLLFLKVIDDREAAGQRDGRPGSPLPEALRWRSWARDGATGDALLAFVEHRLLAALRELPGGALASLIRGVFADVRNTMKSGALLRRVIDTLDGMDLGSGANRHAFGDVYETILADLQSAGNAGEFYTPRALTRFIVEQIDPRLDETVLDPACGTGGFLTCAIEHVRARHVTDAAGETALQASIFGIEKKPLPHLLCVTSLLFHGIDLPSIRRGNALARDRREPGDALVDVVISNPPFGGMEEDAIAGGFPARFRTRDTAALFLADIVARLKPGGRAAVVVPDGELLFQTDGVHARIKQMLLDECRLHTIVRLPRGVFHPYTDTRTNILFFTRGEPTETIWFYEQPCPTGGKGYSRTRPLRGDELAAVQQWWTAREVNDHAWPIDIADVRARRYNLDLKRPAAVDDGRRGGQLLVTDHRSAVAAAEHARRRLLDELHAVLSRHPDTGRCQRAGFEVVAAAASGIRRLREVIFGAAVSGRLVEPHAGDEPAPALLAQLAARPASTGAPRRGSRPRDTHAADDGPRPLPPGWAWARFDRVASIDCHPVSPAQFPELPHVAPDNIEKATGRLLAYRTVREDGVTSSKHRFVPGQILYSKIRPNLSKAVLIDFDGLCSADMYPLTAWIDARYFHSYLLSRTFRDQVVTHDNRLAMPKVNQAQLLATVVAVPPLGEQLRIAERVDHLLALCDELERALRRKEQRAAALADAAIADAVG